MDDKGNIYNLELHDDETNRKLQKAVTGTNVETGKTINFTSQEFVTKLRSIPKGEYEKVMAMDQAERIAWYHSRP